MGFSSARSVEATAYATLSLTQQDRVPDALKAIKWMAGKRNSRGGFVSTQDTVVALQAMSQYAMKVRNKTFFMLTCLKTLIFVQRSAPPTMP